MAAEIPPLERSPAIAWLSFVADCVDPAATVEDVEIMRQCFYAGCLAFLSMLRTAGVMRARGELSPQEDQQVMIDWVNDLDKFLDQDPEIEV